MGKLVETVLEAIKNAPSGITTLDMLESLGLCDNPTLKTTLSRLNKAGKIFRLKRGVYTINPIKDAFAAAQATFSGYIGFSSALYLHNLIAEIPFIITVITTDESSTKAFGLYEFRAVSLKEKAIGFENIGDLTVSTRAKTLFDCIYLERYSIEMRKLVDAYRTKPLSTTEWKEFDSYVNHLATNRTQTKLNSIKKKIKERV